MASTDSKLFQYALQLAKEAVKLDEAKEYTKAMKKYTQAAEVLIEFSKYTRNASLINLCKEKAEEYINRAKELHQKKKVKVKEGGNKGGKSRKKKSDTGDEDGAKSEEEQALEDSLMDTIIMERPDVSWEDIAGLKEPKQALREAVVLPIKHPELFTGARKPWTGILLFGPPGCGKTMLAKAAANEINCTFFVADSSSILSKWLGESEKLVKLLFKLAREKAPSIIFFDEIDSVTTKRGGSSEGGGERRIKTQLLQEIQGMRSDSKRIVTIMGATNRPWDIDSAFLRRFEKKIYVPLPDFESRVAIIKYHTRGISISDDLDFQKLAELTEGYSGSDIAILCREASMRPIRELDQQGSLDQDGNISVRPMNYNDFIESLKKVKPTVSKEELAEYEKWIAEFGG
ncbi:MAG: AAA family ATPase [Promethearchaeota archaeon]